MERRVVFPDPDAPIMPQRPPEIVPLTPFIITLGAWFLFGIVVTTKSCQVKIAGPRVNKSCNLYKRNWN
jgi:hypothetical protein